MSALLSWPSFDGAFALEVTLKATVLLGAAAALARAFHRMSAATRHALWLGGLVASLLLPLAIALLPDWSVPLLPVGESLEAGRGALPTTSVSLDRTPLHVPGASSSAARLDPSAPGALQGWASSEASSGSAVSDLPGSGSGLLRETLGWLWLLGVCAWLAWLIGGVAALRRVARRSESLDGNRGWLHLLEEEAAAARLRRPVRLLRSGAAAAPVTWGVRTPVILLPLESESWSEERRRVVIRHELAHVARWDSLSQLVAGVACGLYWFHPLVWVAARRLRGERERACDERVLASGVSAAEYARHLIEIARTARALRLPTVVTAAMTHSSELEGRVRALLDRRRSRTGSAHPAFLVGCAVLGTVAALSLAAFQAVPRSGIEASPAHAEAGVTRTVAPAKAVDVATTTSPDVTAQPVEPQQAVEVHDSAGVRIVQNGAVAGRSAPFRVSREPIYRFAEGSRFRLTTGALLFADGSAVVVDPEARQLVFLSESGREESVVGSQGEGPGQFDGVYSVSRIDDDTVVVQSERKFTLIHEQRIVRELAVDPAVNRNIVVGVGSDGTLLQGLPIMFPAQRARWLPAVLATVDLATSTVDTIGSFDFAGPFVEHTFGSNGWSTVAAGQLVFGRGDQPELRWMDPDGRLRQIVRWQPPVREVSDSTWAAYESELRSAGHLTESWIQEQLSGLKQTLGSAPVFWKVFGDSEGNVWVSSHGLSVRDHWTPPAYDVVSPRGVWLGTVTAPPDFQILAIGRDRILGLEARASMNPSLVMYRIER